MVINIGMFFGSVEGTKKPNSDARKLSLKLIHAGCWIS